MDIIHGCHPWIISIDITHGIPWGVPWDPRGGTMGTPWVGSLSLLGLMGPLGLIGPLGLMGPQGLMGPGPWAMGPGPWGGGKQKLFLFTVLPKTINRKNPCLPYG